MTGNYGEFTKYIGALDSAQEQVRSVWRDDTAQSYDGINDNVKHYTAKIWALCCDSNGGVDLVRKNYNSDEIDRELQLLGMQIEQV